MKTPATPATPPPPPASIYPVVSAPVPAYPLAMQILAALWLAFATILATATVSAADARPRVLILGDSISIGYTPEVRKLLQDTADVHRPAENCQHTAHGLLRLKTWLGTNHWDVIHFNWGIWDTHMLDAKGQLVRNESAATGPLRLRHTPAQYRTNLVQILDTLTATGARLVWASTTPIMSRSGPRFDDIKTLNAVAAELMHTRRIPLNDLYEFTLPHVAEWQTSDRVHFNATGNQNLGRRVADQIRTALQQPARKSP